MRFKGMKAHPKVTIVKNGMTFIRLWNIKEDIEKYCHGFCPFNKCLVLCMSEMLFFNILVL